MKFIKLNLLASINLLLASSLAWAGPLDEVVRGTEGAVNYVGDAVGNTVNSVGKTVGKTTDSLTGDVDPIAARKEVDTMASGTLDRLFKMDRKAKALFDISYGYAVFDSRKTSFLITVGRGAGVAVEKQSGGRTYMQMAAGGANLGAGIKYFQNVFLFENKQSFANFVNSGWEAGTSGGASFGRDSLSAEVGFRHGMAVFQLSDTGIMLAADITGTKYWKDSALNG